MREDDHHTSTPAPVTVWKAHQWDNGDEGTSVNTLKCRYFFSKEDAETYIEDIKGGSVWVKHHVSAFEVH